MTDGQTGGIQPLRPDGTIDGDALVFDEAPRSRRGMIISGVVVGVLALVAVGAVVAWQALVGSAFATAEAVPIDADVVVTFDLLQVRDSERVDRLIEAFTIPAYEQGLIDDPDVDVLDSIDEELDRELGLTLTDDVIPWIGRSVSLAMWFDPVAPMDEMAYVPADEFVGGVVVAGVRNGGAAEAFVLDVAEAIAQETGGLVERRPLDDGVLTSVGDTPGAAEPLYVWLGGDLMIVGADLEDVQRALGARSGRSILDHEDYSRVMGELPSDRLMAAYVGLDWLVDLYDDPELIEMGGPQVEALQDTLDAVGGVGMAMTLRDEGIAFDVVYGVDDAAALPVSALDASGLEFLERLPVETVFHAAGPIEEDAVASALEPLRENDPVLYDEIAAEAEEFLGVDLFEEVLPALGREAVVAVVPSDEGFVAEELGVPVGGVAAIGVDDRDPVAAAVAVIEDLAPDQGLDVMRFGEVSVVMAEGSSVLAYAVGDDALVLGSGPLIVDALLSGVDVSVVDNPRYRELDELLPGAGVPFFVDFQGIFDLVDLEAAERAPVDALRAAGASGEITDDLVQFSVMVAIDY